MYAYSISMCIVAHGLVYYSESSVHANLFLQPCSLTDCTIVLLRRLFVPMIFYILWRYRDVIVPCERVILYNRGEAYIHNNKNYHDCAL